MSKKNSPAEEEVITVNIQPFLMPVSLLLSILILSTSIFFGLGRIATAIDGGGTGVLGTTDTVQAGGDAADVVVTEGSTSIDDDAVKGDKESAKVAIVEFSDFECPFCQNFYNETLSQIESEYIDSGEVILVYRDLPLSFHAQAQIQAEAAECVKREGGDDAYYRAHDAIFDAGGQLDEAQLISLADDLGYDIDSCLTNGEATAEVEADAEDAAEAGVSATPGFIIGTLNDDGTVDGEVISGAQPFSVFEETIQKYL